MKVVGIVAEYNPFHNGHKYQIEYAKNQLKADYVIVAMSGSFSQRGAITCLDKYTRAKCALLSGADIVLEIPTIFSTASAKEFASAGVKLLASTGIVDTVLFGAETDDEALFIKTARKIIELEKNTEYQNQIKNSMADGLSYAAARANALSSIDNSDIISLPNNILGLEYTKYIIENNLKIDIACLKRKGNNYHSTVLTEEFSSASAIRKCLNNHQTVNIGIPEELFPLFTNTTFTFDNDVSQLLHYKLVTEEDFSDYLDCNEDISKRINNLKSEYVEYTSFCELLKTKNVSYTRISRILCHILLGIKNKDFIEQKEKGYITYIRMLGFSENGCQILGNIKNNANVPVITSPTDQINKFDIIASDIYRAVLTGKTGKTYPTEYTRKFDLKNI